MGLDLVEIVMGTEEEFNIKFNDEELYQIKTVGEFYSLLLLRIKQLEKKECYSNKVFYKLRRAIIEITETKRNEVKPKSNIYDLLGKNEFSLRWKELEFKTNYKLPKLGYHPLFSFVFYTSNIIFFIYFFATIVTFFRINIILLILFIVTDFLISKFINKKYLEKHFRIIRNLVESIVVKEYPKDDEFIKNNDDQKIWNDLVSLISDHLGIDKKLVVKDATFIEDLGCD